MGLKRGVRVAAVLTAECTAFSLALLAVMWSLGDLLNSWWAGVVVTGVVYSVIGALPVPQRRLVLIGIAAFVVPLAILGWIDWRIEYFLMFAHVGAWENLPRILLGPENLAVAAFLSLCAIVGQGVSRRIATRVAERPAQAQESRIRK